MTPQLSQSFLVQRSRSWLTLPGRGRYAAKFLSNITDQYFINRFFEAGLYGTKNLALVAVGGYGRREMALKSDIDILIMTENPNEGPVHEMAAGLFHPLWDYGLEVGHGLRSIEECIKLAENDPMVLTSLIDIRFICGDEKYFCKFQSRIDVTLKDKRNELVLYFVQTRGNTLYGGSPENFIEPDIKNHPGGIRDLNLISWLRKMDHLSRPQKYTGTEHSDEAVLKKISSFFFDLRNILHSSGKRKNDTLHLDLQPEVASVMGYKGHGKSTGVEVFLQDLFKNQNLVLNLAMEYLEKSEQHVLQTDRCVKLDVIQEDRVINRGGRLYFKKDAVLKSDPELSVEIFRIMAESNFPVSWQAKKEIRNLLSNDQARRAAGRALITALPSIITGMEPGKCLRGMHQTGLLGLILPELEKRWYLVQFDGVHTYPLGEHTLKCLNEISGLDEKNDFLHQHLKEVKWSQSLRLAALMHDMGKGGPEHEKEGAKLAEKALKRLGVDSRRSSEIKFLIENHLLMVSTALKKDLDEKKVVAEFARQVGSIRRLKLLALLSYADSMATGPGIWSSWKENLLSMLYHKTERLMKKTILAGHHTGHRMAMVRDRIRSHQDYQAWWENYIEHLPERYLLKTPVAKIIRHIKLVQNMSRFRSSKKYRGSEQDFILLTEKTCEHGGELWELTLATHDRRGLMACVASALAMNSIQIYSAGFYTWDNKIAVDMFKVSPPVDPLYSGQVWREVRKDIQTFLDGSRDMAQLCGRYNIKPGPGSRFRISVDNDSSDFYTMLEISAPSHPYLTLKLCMCLSRLGLDISHAVISTHMEQTTHVFHVRGSHGSKIIHNRKDLIKNIHQALT
ncbi:MAG: HD domain-containing protein [Desulfonatronovibrio sp. MSAO_Bac4]|nr:MAG: HD domain-containing protein [Desulfonatronovibrio sp. MSAO_Bac4]